MEHSIVTGKRRKNSSAAAYNRQAQSGMTYLVVLFLVVLVGMGLSALGTVWGTEMQRDRERELIFIGEQFGVALKRYYDASPAVKEYPKRLEDLLEDRRQPVPRRYLRQIFVDPLTGQRDWVVVMTGGQIAAIHSRSKGKPLVSTGFPPEWVELASAQTHAEWVFRPLEPRSSMQNKPAEKPENEVTSFLKPDAESPQVSAETLALCESRQIADYAVCQAGPRQGMSTSETAKRQACSESAVLRYSDCLQGKGSVRALLQP